MELEPGSGSYESLETHIDESRSSKHSEVSLRAIDGSGSSSFEKHADSVDGNNVTDESGSVGRQETRLGNHDGSDRNHSSTMQVSSSASLSSSLLSSSSDSSVDHSQDESEESRDHDSGSQPTTKDDESSFTSDSTLRSKEDDTSPADSESTFQVSVTHETPVPGMRSPPVQTMERIEGYDPHRIPSSIFESKPATQMEWSVASNESLFSLHIGNSSFSKEQFFVFGDFKSGEFPKSSEIVMFSPPSRTSALAAAEIEGKSLQPEERESVGAKELRENPIKDKASLSAVGSSEKMAPPMVVSSISSIQSHHAEEGGTSTSSFAFPIKKKKKSRRPSCYCSSCSWALCCLIRRPTCHFRYFACPSCHCPSCSGLFCYGWNCGKKTKSSHSLPVVPEVPKTESMKPEGEKLHLEAVPAKKTSKSTTACSWFPCLSWCSWCWSCSCPRHCCQCRCSSCC